jgi:hypothetical protein
VVIEYKCETTQLVRILLFFLGALTIIFTCSIFSNFFFYPMAISAFPLIENMLQGDFTSINDVLICFVFITIFFGILGISLYALIFTALLAPNQYTRLDFEAGKVFVKQKYLLLKEKNISYSFNDINYLELENEHLDSGGEKLKLYLHSQKMPIILCEIYGHSECCKYGILEDYKNGFSECYNQDNSKAYSYGGHSECCLMYSVSNGYKEYIRLINLGLPKKPGFQSTA